MKKKSRNWTNAQQIRETSQGFLVSNTLFKTVATRANWPTHRIPAMRRDTPIPNLNMVEMPMSKRTKLREIATLIHVNSLLAIGRGRERISGKNHTEDLKLGVVLPPVVSRCVRNNWNKLHVKLNSESSASTSEILVSCSHRRGSFSLLLCCKVFAAWCFIRPSLSAMKSNRLLWHLQALLRRVLNENLGRMTIPVSSKAMLVRVHAAAY